MKKFTFLVTVGLGILSSPVMAGDLTGSYTSAVRHGNKVYYFSEQDEKGVKNCPGGARCHGIVLYTAPWDKLNNVSYSGVIAPNSLISDVTGSNKLLTRLAVSYHSKDQRYYAVAHVSNSYPPTDGKVTPALFRSKSSNPNGGWEYLKKIPGFNGYYSGNTLILNESKSEKDPIDLKNPLNHKFLIYSDAYNISASFSNDGVNWQFLRDANKKIVSMRPAQFSSDSGWIFPSAVKTKNHGLFMFISVGWVPTAHRLMHSTDGIVWKQLQAYPAGPKNYTLSYDESSDQIIVQKTKTPSKHEKTMSLMKPSDFVKPVTATPPPVVVIPPKKPVTPPAVVILPKKPVTPPAVVTPPKKPVTPPAVVTPPKKPVTPPTVVTPPKKPVTPQRTKVPTYKMINVR